MRRHRISCICLFIAAFVVVMLLGPTAHAEPIRAAEIKDVLGSGPFTIDPGSGVFASQFEQISYGFSLNMHEFELFELFLGIGEGSGNGLLHIPSLTLCDAPEGCGNGAQLSITTRLSKPNAAAAVNKGFERNIDYHAPYELSITGGNWILADNIQSVPFTLAATIDGVPFSGTGFAELYGGWEGGRFRPTAAFYRIGPEQPAPVPEPSTLALLSIGLAASGWKARRLGRFPRRNSTIS